MKYRSAATSAFYRPFFPISHYRQRDALPRLNIISALIHSLLMMAWFYFRDAEQEVPILDLRQKEATPPFRYIISPRLAGRDHGRHAAHAKATTHGRALFLYLAVY